MSGMIRIIAICVALMSVAVVAQELPASATPEAIALFKQAQERMQRWEWDEAAELFEQAWKADASLTAARFGQAACYLKQDRHGDAYPIFKELEKADPERPALLNNIAWVHVTSLDPLVRDIEKGLYYARRAMVEAPLDLNVWATLAEGYFQRGDYMEAHRVAQLARNISRDQGGGEVFELALLVERCAAAIVKDETGELSGENGQKEKR